MSPEQIVEAAKAVAALPIDGNLRTLAAWSAGASSKLLQICRQNSADAALLKDLPAKNLADLPQWLARAQATIQETARLLASVERSPAAFARQSSEAAASLEKLLAIGPVAYEAIACLCFLSIALQKRLGVGIGDTEAMLAEPLRSMCVWDGKFDQPVANASSKLRNAQNVLAGEPRGDRVKILSAPGWDFDCVEAKISIDENELTFFVCIVNPIFDLIPATLSTLGPDIPGLEARLQSEIDAIKTCKIALAAIQSHAAAHRQLRGILLDYEKMLIAKAA